MNLLSDLELAGVTIRLANAGQDLRITPKSLATEEVIAQVKANKSEIIQFLTDSSALEESEGIGAGSELKKIIPSWFARPGCGCVRYARAMDRIGVDACEEQKEKIVTHLVTQAKRNPILTYVPTKRFFAGKLVDQAIGRAKHNLSDTNGNWFVAVTTAPRQECTLKDCILSLRVAGWEPTVFAEPGSTTTNAHTICNSEKLGVWRNWVSACTYAIEQTNANLILTVQDDCLFHPDSRDFVERILWPNAKTGFISLYTPKHYSIIKKEVRDPGVRRIYTKSLWGACALAWDRETLERVLDHKITKKWLGAPPRSGKKSVIQKRKDNPHLIANSDTAIGKVMNSLDLQMWYIDPSPVLHISAHSTVGHGDNKGRRNCWRCADHNVPLLDQVPIHTLQEKEAPVINTPLDYASYPAIDQVVVTSFSPNRLMEEKMAMQTWQRLGVKLIAVQLHDEVDQVKSVIDDIEIRAVGQRHPEHHRVALLDILNLTKEFGNVIYTNSDIENYYNQEEFQQHWIDVPDKCLQMGKRWDYTRSKDKSVKNFWGIDIFRFTVDMLPLLQEESFCVGVPVWDYWIPWVLYHADWRMRSDPAAKFYHRLHEVRYDRRSRTPYLRIMQDKYEAPDRATFSNGVMDVYAQAEQLGRAMRNDADLIDDKVYFEHVPKCGGSSLKYALRPLFHDEYFFNDRSEYKYRGEQFVYGHQLWKSGMDMSSGFRITTIRHPVQRLISLFNHLHYRRKHPDHELAKKLPLERCGEISGEFHNYMVRTFSRFTQDECQRKPDEAIEAALAYLQQYNLVGNTDKMDVFTKHLSDMLDLERPLKIRRENKAIGKVKVSKKAKEIIRSQNQLDLRFYFAALEHVNKPR